ncbi:hypothetical protein D3C80_1507540 [compost metagenome]
MRQGYFAQGTLVQQAQLTGGLTRRRQTIIKAASQRTGFAVAGLVRVFAGFVPGDQLKNPQGWRVDALKNHLGGTQRQFAPRGFRREEKHLVQFLRRHSLEHGK